MSVDHERTASLMTPAKLAQMKPKAAASPAAWLDQMAADAGRAHVRQLAALVGQLRIFAAQRDHDGVAVALAQLAQELPQLDFALLQPKGWLARATGKAKTAGSEFASQHEKLAEAVHGLKQQGLALVKQQQAVAAGGDRMLVEFEVEWKAIDKILDQGARWLQDMRNQLKTRQAALPDADAQRQIDEDAARCELLVGRLKMLRAVSAAAQQAHPQAQQVVSRRAALVQGFQQLNTHTLKAWEARLGPVAATAAEGGTVADTGPAVAAQAEMQTRVSQLTEDCTQLQAQERALATQLEELARQLQAA